MLSHAIFKIILLTGVHTGRNRTIPEPPVSWASHVPLSKRAQFILHHGLDKKTHTMYKSYQRTYEDYCYGEGFHNPYPATPEKLVEWVALRAEGSIERGQSRIKAESILQGLSAIRAVHVARFLPTTAFNNPSVKLAVQDQDTMIKSSDNDPAPTLTPTQRRRPRDTSEGLSEKAIIPTNAPYATRSSVKNSHVIDILRNSYFLS